jgi:hypothetical protein
MKPTSRKNKPLSPKQAETLLKTLEDRFEKNLARHKGLTWAKVRVRLETSPESLWSLFQMEETGGEPDVVAYDKKTGECVFFDCSKESPSDRRSFCYDREARQERTDHPPKYSALEEAEAMGIELLTEEEYRTLQALGSFDEKSSSWVQTPDAIRKLGGAIFCDRRYNHVFTYHNGASSYYAARGFRGSLRV